MDLATLIGLALGFTVVGAVMIMDGGSPAELFAHPSAILLTVGGAIAAATISFPLKTVLSLPALFMGSIRAHKAEGSSAIEVLVSMADKARREGLLALEDDSKKIDDPFLRRGVMLVVDGVDPAQVRSILEIEVEQMSERHARGIGFLNAVGGFAPTMGIIGTVMGLVSVLKQLSDPGKLGASIAAAFLATLWGIMTANLLWLPLAGKLRSKSEEEIAYRHLLVEGILALQAGENPRIIREKLSAFLPPKAREGSKGKEKGKEKDKAAAASRPAEVQA
jgi:chemotaxis protein MotA